LAAILESEPAQIMDQSALAQLFEENYDRVFRAAFRVTGNAGDAEDVAQTVFLRLARRPQEVAAVHHPSAYLHRAAVHAALDLIRSKRVTTSVNLDDAAMEPGHSLSVRAEAGEAVPIRLWLRQAIASLSPRQAEIFTLRYIEGYDNREIARMLGTSQIVVGVTLHRVRSLLKGQLEAMQKRAK
jgi:RNA polymerase sigma-70 factor (ECF subfamily)